MLVGGRNTVVRRGGVVHRPAEPWSAGVLALLRHLEAAGFDGAPRVVGSGFDEEGRETLTWVEGGFVHPGPWGEAGLHRLGAMVRRLHDAAAGFVPPPGATWRPWSERVLGDADAGWGHGDAGPWNVVARDGLPAALIDWETAGPMDPLTDLAQACWLNAQLHDDEVAARAGLADAATRARHLGLMLDGYGMARARRPALVGRVIEVAVLAAADQAIEARVTPETTAADALWGLAWRTRAAAWMVRHRAVLAG